MDFKAFYYLPEKDIWSGRQDSELPERFFQIISFKEYDEILTSPFPNPALVIAGFACDEGVRRNFGRIGAKLGPNALRRSLANLPIHFQTSPMSVFDVGDIVCLEDRLEEAQIALAHLVKTVIDQKGFPLVLGGGHETAWGHYQGLASGFEKSNLAIVNFDAHFDMRPMLGEQGTSGTPFLQIALDRQAKALPFNYYCLGIKGSGNTSSLFDTANKWNVNYLTCDEIFASQNALNEFIERILSQHDAVYLSVCLDVLAASFAPGVSASSPYGLFPAHVLSGIRQLAQSGKVIAMDVVELAPELDQGDMSAKMGALCIAEFVYHQAGNPR